MSEIVDKWRSLQKGPRVPRPTSPRVPAPPRYDVREIQSIDPTPAKLAESRRAESERPGRAERLSERSYAPRIPQRRELTAQEMGSLYPELVAKRPELLNRLAKRGVTYYIDPLLGQRRGAAGEYDPGPKTVTVQARMPVGVAAHEVVHADLSTGPLNVVRYLTDRNYRSARMEDLFREGDTWLGHFIRKAWFKETAAADPSDPFALLEERRREFRLREETFAMGAGGSSVYMDYPVDYYDANRLFGGTLDQGYVRTTGGRTGPANRDFGNLQYRHRSYSPIRGR